jgi:hypothetical protein
VPCCATSSFLAHRHVWTPSAAAQHCLYTALLPADPCVKVFHTARPLTPDHSLLPLINRSDLCTWLWHAVLATCTAWMPPLGQYSLCWIVGVNSRRPLLLMESGAAGGWPVTTGSWWWSRQEKRWVLLPGEVVCFEGFDCVVLCGQQNTWSPA